MKACHDPLARGPADEKPPLTDAARQRQQLWGSDPVGGARFTEPHTRPLFEASGAFLLVGFDARWVGF